MDPCAFLCLIFIHSSAEVKLKKSKSLSLMMLENSHMYTKISIFFLIP